MELQLIRKRWACSEHIKLKPKITVISNGTMCAHTYVLTCNDIHLRNCAFFVKMRVVKMCVASPLYTYTHAHT